jgi:murein DD-endopeptidase MepM/ murein hydrolase activator NlpD
MEYNKVTNSELKNISRGYGMKMHPIKKIMKKHSGIDIPVSTGHDIYAIADGTIVDSEIRKNACGGTIKVDHGVIDGKKIETRFCHCSQLLKQKGDEVKKGDIIAKSGGGKGDVGQGGSTGSHIHFEVYENGKTVDSMKYYTGGQNFQTQNSTTNQPTNNDNKIEIPKISNDSVQRELLKSLLGKIGWEGLVDLIPDEPSTQTKNEKIEFIKDKTGVSPDATTINSLKENEVKKINNIIGDINRIKTLMK